MWLSAFCVAANYHRFFSQTDFSTIDRSDGRGKGGVGRRCDSADGDKTSIWKGRSCWLEGQERLRFTRRSARLPKDRARSSNLFGVSRKQFLCAGGCFPPGHAGEEKAMKKVARRGQAADALCATKTMQHPPSS